MKSPLFGGMALLLLVAGCSKIFPPPLRPETDGYSAQLRESIGEKVRLYEVAVLGENRLIATGNPGTRRITILRPDRGILYEVDEAARTVGERSLLPSDRLHSSNGFYPFDLVKVDERDADYFARLYEDDSVTMHRLADAVLGLNVCDVLRIDRQAEDGSGLAETWYIGRAYSGLVLRREVQTFAEGAFGETIEVDYLADLEIGIERELFEPPADYRKITLPLPTDPPPSPTVSSSTEEVES